MRPAPPAARETPGRPRSWKHQIRAHDLGTKLSHSSVDSDNNDCMPAIKAHHPPQLKKKKHIPAKTHAGARKASAFSILRRNSVEAFIGRGPSIASPNTRRSSTEGSNGQIPSAVSITAELVSPPSILNPTQSFYSVTSVSVMSGAGPSHTLPIGVVKDVKGERFPASEIPVEP